jgi:DNA (cytosine-5)-methyltransferase 1
MAVCLFSGIGGFELALRRAGVPTVVAVEIDPTCRAVLARHFPDTTLLNDVTEVTGDQLLAAGFDPRVGGLTGGWPCQGNSVSGRRGGMDDPRSGLWMHFRRLLAELRPRWFIGENVPGLLSVRHGADWAIILDDLADLGYGWAYRVLDAQFFGVPQRRRRVFIVGHLGDRAAPVQVLFEPESSGRNPAPSTAPRADIAETLGSLTGGARTTDLDGHGAYIPFDAAQITHPENRVNPQPGDPAAPLAATGQPMIATAVTAYAVQPERGQAADLLAREVDLAPTLTAVEPNRTDRGLRLATSAAVRRLTPVECERLQGFPDGWTEGHSDTTRYRLLGNAVAVPVVEWIARRIHAAEATR